MPKSRTAKRLTKRRKPRVTVDYGPEDGVVTELVSPTLVRQGPDGSVEVISSAADGSKRTEYVTREGDLREEVNSRLEKWIKEMEGKPTPAGGVCVVIGTTLQAGSGSKRVLTGTATGPQAADEPSMGTSRLAGLMAPESDVPTPGQALQAQRNAQARAELLFEFGAFSSESLGELRSSAKNKHALANRWRNEGKIFAVEQRGMRLYPGFQFDSDSWSPKPIVGNVLSALPTKGMSSWEIALWWTAANGWLGSQRPVDLIDSDEKAILSAARHLAEPSPF